MKRQVAVAKAAAEAKARESAWVPTGDDRGQADAGRGVNVVVSIMVGALMAAYLLPMAINELAAVDTSAWTDGAAALWNILPVMIVLAVFIFFTGVAIRRSEGV